LALFFKSLVGIATGTLVVIGASASIFAIVLDATPGAEHAIYTEHARNGTWPPLVVKAAVAAILTVPNNLRRIEWILSTTGCVWSGSARTTSGIRGLRRLRNTKNAITIDTLVQFRHNDLILARET
jgi:hypothetical protein